MSGNLKSNRWNLLAKRFGHSWSDLWTMFTRLDSRSRGRTFFMTRCRIELRRHAWLFAIWAANRIGAGIRSEKKWSCFRPEAEMWKRRESSVQPCSITFTVRPERALRDIESCLALLRGFPPRWGKMKTRDI